MAMAVWALLALAATAAAEPAHSVASTLAVLDLDHSGFVNESEVEHFAESQGLGPAQAKAEFQDLDKNHDGILQASEISASLGAAQAAGATPGEEAKLNATRAPEAAAVAAAEGANASEGRLLAETSTTNETAMLEIPWDVAKEASRMVTVEFAKRAQKALSQRVDDASGAASLAAMAAHLRSNASALAQAAPEMVRKAAEEASEAKVREAMKRINELQKEASTLDAAAVTARHAAGDAAAKAAVAESSMSAEVARLRSESQ